MVSPTDTGEVLFTESGRTYRERPESLTMSRHRLEALVRRFQVGQRPQWTTFLAMLGIFLATVPSLLPNDYTAEFLIPPDDWKIVMQALAFGSIVGMAVTAFRAIGFWIRDLPWMAWHLHWLPGIGRPTDWVPANPSDFVEFIVREIEEEDRNAKQSAYPSSDPQEREG